MLSGLYDGGGGPSYCAVWHGSCFGEGVWGRDKITDYFIFICSTYILFVIFSVCTTGSCSDTPTIPYLRLFFAEELWTLYMVTDGLRSSESVRKCFVCRRLLSAAYSFSEARSRLRSHSALSASLGMRQSPRGERLTEPTLGPSGSADLLNCWLKKRRTKIDSQ